MRIFLLLFIGIYAQVPRATAPIGSQDSDFDFAETQTEKAGGWSLKTRCGQAAVAGLKGDQRSDVKCPNVIVINTDDMAWGDLSINNPSKLIPTPNIDKLVSRGINFRDGHSCSARCGPSRYCIMTGRHHFRRGNYHYNPIVLEYGRKILSHLFKRNNYKTILVGKDQPCGTTMRSHDNKGDNYWVEGTRFWGFDRSFTSVSYLINPGGGYFKDDESVEPFDHFSFYSSFRDASEHNHVMVNRQTIDRFLKKPENFHLLDGWTVDGNLNSERRPSTYMAYWTAIKNGWGSGLNDARRRRRRSLDGKKLKRDYRKRRSVDITDRVIHEGHRFRREEEQKKKKRTDGEDARGYARYMEKSTGNVFLADYKLGGWHDQRVTYEFGADGNIYPSLAAAEKAKADLLLSIIKEYGKSSSFYKQLKNKKIVGAQKSYDSKTTMFFHKHHAVNYIKEHVDKWNPVKANGESRPAAENKPFFMYLAFRAPHAPYSHNLTFNEIQQSLPHAIIGKPGEQIRLLDSYVGNIMQTLHEKKVAENTFVVFTSDNGPDGTGFKLFNELGHLRTATLRGKKATVYEGGHRVPMPIWWPLGTHPALQGTNFDLPVSQLDFFATFADLMEYPLPDADKCLYAYNSNNAPEGKDPSELGRPGLYPGMSRGTWIKAMKNWDWADKSKKLFSSEPIAPATGGRKFSDEVSGLGFKRTETFLTKEDLTGFLVGWEGCMAEDSMSFKGAFTAEKVSEREEDGKTIHSFTNTLSKRHSFTASGKLGDLSIRVGRYKLIRFNAPKDVRTGGTRQHLVPHHGKSWLSASEQQKCRYHEITGAITVPGCTVEPQCRFSNTFGQEFCMRDHYYQLWDLEKNFGEKMLCKKTDFKRDPYGALADALDIGRATWMGEKVAEKPTNPDGIAVGIEISPKEMWLNDCCVLNTDEDKSRALPLTLQRHRSGDPCSAIKFQVNGKERNAGNCVYMKKNSFYGETYEQFLAYAGNEQTKMVKKYGRFGYTADTHFRIPSEEDYTPGYTCSGLFHALPDKNGHAKQHAKIWDDNFNGGSWRHATKLDKLCNPDREIETIAQPTEAPVPTRPSIPDPCKSVKLMVKGKEVDGGTCSFKRGIAMKFGNDYQSFLTFRKKDMMKSLRKTAKMGFTEATHFKLPTEEGYKPGFVCSKVAAAVAHVPTHPRANYKIWDEGFGGWRHTTNMDRLCDPDGPVATAAPTTAAPTTAGPTGGLTGSPGRPTAAPPTPPANTKPFVLGCKVPDHNGPLGEGWEANSAWSTSFDKDRRTNPEVQNGELDSEEFGEWTPFATCLKNALQLIEGQAYFKETNPSTGRSSPVDTNLRPISDNGTPRGYEHKQDMILAGHKVGASNYAQSHAQSLFDIMRNEGETREFHGAGTRYNEKPDGSDAIVLNCIKHLPERVKNDPKLQPFAIQPNFDLDMDLLGWYVSGDQTGGNIKEAVFEGNDSEGKPIYSNNRTVQKYYKTHGGKHLTGFGPVY